MKRKILLPLLIVAVIAAVAAALVFRGEQTSITVVTNANRLRFFEPRRVEETRL